MSCPQCFAGHVNPGSPTGRVETVFGRRTYVAEPPAGKKAKGIIVIIPDAFGIDFVNNQILADHYATGGDYLVYLPDFMDGTAASVQCMKNMALATDKKASWTSSIFLGVKAAAEFIPFMIRNRYGVAWPRVVQFFTSLRQEGPGATLPVGVAGFCWGGLHAIYLTHDKADTKTASGKSLVDVAFTAHPSNVTAPGDFEAATKPLSVAIGDADFVMPLKQVTIAKQVLESRNSPGGEVVIYEGAGHGFSIRASKAEPDSKETRQAEEAEKQALAWFQKHLAGV